ncbi:YaaC family protein [Sorangium sp. So ce693]|uniref:YaaC family protein n=1 Tax=Sorangium sp. So ce693 TaxID=3133318 RepID=UPI003F61E2E2
MRTVPTENPLEDLWRRLRRYCYPENVRRLLQERHSSTPPPTVVDTITAAVVQADEYFQAARSTTLQVSPLLLYYGATNLMAAYRLCSSPVAHALHHHGMTLGRETDGTSIGDIKIAPDQSPNGGLQAYRLAISPSAPSLSSAWSLRDIFGSIPDLHEDFLDCYPAALPLLLPIEVVKTRSSQFDRIARRSLAKHGESAPLGRVPGFASYYRPAEYTETYVILRRKLRPGAPISISSLSGRQYLPIARPEDRGHAPPVVILYLMGLFALGTLSRYHADVWSPFVRNDTTGERWLVEKFVALAARHMPNLVLDMLVGENLVFVAAREGIRDESSQLTDADVRELIEKRLKESPV